MPTPLFSFDWKGPPLPQELLEFLSSREWFTFALGVHTPNPEEKREKLLFWRGVFSKSDFFKDKKLVMDFPDINVLVDESAQRFDAHIFPLIVSGKYLKLRRGIAQTTHFCFACKGVGKKKGSVCPTCKGKKTLTNESVQELIAPFFQSAFACESLLFHGA